MKYKSIIFDLDGTILYTIKTIRQAINYSFTKNGFTKQTVSDINNALGKGGVNLLKQLLPNSIAQSKFKMVYQDYKEYYNNNPFKLSKPYPGVINILKQLKKEGYLLALISNKEDEITKQIVEKIFPNIFVYVTGAKPNCPIKPDPYFVNCFLTTNNIKNNDAIYVGDSDVDFLTAFNAGVKFVAVTWGYRSKQDLTKLGQTLFIDKIKNLLCVLNY